MIEMIDPAAPVSYVLKAERESENQTVFWLRGLTSSEKLRLAAKTNSAGGSYVLGIDGLLFVLGCCLVGWDNAPQVFDRNNQQRNLDALKEEHLVELGREVMAMSGIGSELKKK